MKKFLALILSLSLVFSLAACTGKTQAPKEKAQIKIASLKGPTGIGTAKLMSDNEAGTTKNSYTVSLVSDPNEVASGIIAGTYDVAACPLNLASVLYKKTNGNIQMLNINTLGVLYLLENGNTINSINDLAGKTIYATGQGATPEYVLNYILEKNGLKDKVKIEYKAQHAELATLMASGEVVIGMLPEPNVTSTIAQNKNVRIALNLTKEFEKVSGVSLAMGCLVVRKDFAEANKAAIDTFMQEYKASVEYTKTNLDETSTLCETYGIIPKAAMAKMAIPNCNITFIAKADMKKMATENLTVLMNANPQSVGGAIPGEDFWYGA
ncbi:MAG: MqnA/MqnD/SBP family protein [Oscillospiraceae bacterium]